MLTDFHIHSSCSPDAYDTMLDMAKAAHAHGVSVMCFTDHVDLDDYATGKPIYTAPDILRDIAKTHSALAGKTPDGIEVLRGMELGQPNHDPQRAMDIVAHTELDFIIGSLHNLKDTPDFSMLEYRSVDECHSYIRKYLTELLEIADLDCFDVMGHIGYTQRYMMRDGFNIAVTLEHFGDELEALFSKLISKGKGIEINCAGFRNAINDTVPAESTLRLYRELGGEIITVGSDAHCVQDAAIGNAEGMEALRRAGFEYFTIFRDRKAEFIKL